MRTKFGNCSQVTLPCDLYPAYLSALWTLLLDEAFSHRFWIMVSPDFETTSILSFWCVIQHLKCSSWAKEIIHPSIWVLFQKPMNNQKIPAHVHLESQHWGSRWVGPQDSLASLTSWGCSRPMTYPVSNQGGQCPRSTHLCTQVCMRAYTWTCLRTKVVHHNAHHDG